MVENYRVDTVYDCREGIKTQFGPMRAWRLNVTNLGTGMNEDVQILSKPNNAYCPTDTLWAERSVDEYGTRLKRKQAPMGAGNGQTQPQATQPIPQGSPQKPAPAPYAPPPQPRRKMAYKAALELYGRICSDLGVAHDGGHATTILLSVIRGDIEFPLSEEDLPPF